MKILSIIAQKPDFTGSGIYLCEIVKCFESMGIEQAIICGIDKNEKINIFDDESKNINNIFPVYFNCEDMPFNVVGMSDEMPYESMRYIDLLNDEKKLNIWKKSFTDKVFNLINDFKPDVIICHHLYLLTAIVENVVQKNNLSNIKICGICHNTDIRQYKKIDLERNFIKENIKKLDKILVPSEAHKKQVEDIIMIDGKNIEVVGIGYNNKIFYIDNECARKSNFVDGKINLMYVGKIANKKGVLSLVKAIKIFNEKFVSEIKKANDASCINEINVNLVGGAGNAGECESIIENAINVADNVIVSENLINRKKIIDNIILKKEHTELQTELVNDILLIKKQKRKISDKIEKSENELCRDAKINISFYGKKSQNEIAKMYNENDIFVLVSFSEGIPMVVVEALACGMKILISDLPGVKEFLNENTKNAVVEYVTLPKLTDVDSATNEELEKYEERIAKSLSNIIKMDKANKVEVANLTWESIARRILFSKSSS